jgi:hypothetical protein
MVLYVSFAAAAGFFGGCWAGFGLKTAVPEPRRIQEYPLPYHIPKYKDGISFRFAMVHDVLHERFPRHSKEYYEKRNIQVRQALVDAKDKAATFPLLDDLGAGLEFLGDHEGAVKVLRDKLEQQRELCYQGKDLYTSYANLGTFLIHGSFLQARAGDPVAKERLREGLTFIYQAIDVNPEAHFGREIWQAAAVEFMLAVMDDTRLLTAFDMVGNRLDLEVDPRNVRSFDAATWGMAGLGRDVASYLDNPDSRPAPTHLREWITPVGAEEGWQRVVKTLTMRPLPFDEPTLGIIGMWRLGGGANPHFALALGEIMMRVGQRHIAWCAYERAVLMKDRFWPDDAIQQKLVDHCRRRQSIVETQLPSDDVRELRPRFVAELAFGKRYQQAYEQYETDRLAAGTSMEDPSFYDAFMADNGPIASPVGNTEKFVAERPDILFPVQVVFSSALFFAGLSAFVTALLTRLRFRAVSTSPQTSYLASPKS